MRLERFRLLSVTMLFLFIMSLAVISVKSDDYTATIYVDPQGVVDEAMGSGSTFDLAFKIRDAVNCYSWSMNLSWDPTVLTIIGMTYGDFFAGQPEGSTWNYRFEIPLGWAYIGEMTNGEYEGVDGNGWLINFTFQVLDYGHSDLNIDDPKTYIMVYPPYPPTREEVNKENGYFRNLYPGDIDGNKNVGSSDFSILAGAYGSSCGQPAYDREADFNLDCNIGSADFSVLAGNYGKTFP